MPLNRQAQLQTLTDNLKFNLKPKVNFLTISMLSLEIILLQGGPQTFGDCFPLAVSEKKSFETLLPHTP